LEKDEVAQSNGDILGCFLFGQIYYIFTEAGKFKTWFAEGILRFQKWFNVDILDFQLELSSKYFGFFGLKAFFGQFLKNWAIIFQKLWSPCFSPILGN
jgi:hypothetical protein